MWKQLHFTLHVRVCGCACKSLMGVLEAPDADSPRPLCAREVQGPPEMRESTSSFPFLQINPARETCSLQLPVGQFDVCQKNTHTHKNHSLRQRRKSCLISLSQKWHFVLDFGKVWEGERLPDAAIKRWSSRENIKIPGFFFFSHNCQVWFLWLLLRRKWSCKQHFQLSTQPEPGSEIAFVPPHTSICPQKSRIAGKALETKGAVGVALLRAPIHRLLIVYLFIWLEGSAAIMLPRSERIRGEIRGCMNQGVRCDLSTGSHVIMLPPLDQLEQHQASLGKKQIQTIFF